MKLIAIKENNFGAVQWKVGDIVDSKKNRPKLGLCILIGDGNAMSLKEYPGYFIPLAQFREERINEILND